MTDLEKIASLLISPIQENNILGLSIAVRLGVSVEDCLVSYARELGKIANRFVIKRFRIDITFFGYNLLLGASSCLTMAYIKFNGETIESGIIPCDDNFQYTREQFIGYIKPVMIEKYNELAQLF